MKKVNLADVPTGERVSPSGKFARSYQEISVALGSEFRGLDPAKKHPFDLAVVSVPPGKFFCPYHSHSAQWEMYLIISGRGTVRDETGRHDVGPNDAFIYAPNAPHQISNPGNEDLIYYILADNPPGDSTWYPDSKKWMVWKDGERAVIQGHETDYWTDEDA